MIILSVHAILVDNKNVEAPANVVRDNILKNTTQDLLYIRHFMKWEKRSEVLLYRRGKIVYKKHLFVFRYFNSLRYVSEIISSFLFIIFHTKWKITYVWFNPLNAFIWYLLNIIGKTKKNIFYTPDYSPIRFNNKLLNYIYHNIDKLCVFWSDEVWNVSSEIYKIREKMGLKKEKNIFIPNMPWFLKSTKKTNQYSIITSGLIENQLDYFNFIDAIKILKKDFPNIIFYIAWEWSYKQKIKDYVSQTQMTKHVILLWSLEYHDYIKLLSTCSIGLALYNGNFWFNIYWDSMKCREFTCFGIPIITTRLHSTAWEIEKSWAWIIVRTEKEWEDYINAIQKIFENYRYYEIRSYELWNKYHNYYLSKILELC